MERTTNLGGRNRNEKRTELSLDTWAVTLALALVFLVWSGAIKHIPW